MRPVSEAVVPPQQPGEKFTDYLERIATVNGWMQGGKAVKSMPAGTRLPYREPREPGEDTE